MKRKQVTEINGKKKERTENKPRKPYYAWIQTTRANNIQQQYQ